MWGIQKFISTKPLTSTRQALHLGVSHNCEPLVSYLILDSFSFLPKPWYNWGSWDDKLLIMNRARRVMAWPWTTAQAHLWKRLQLDFSPKRLKQDEKKRWFLSMCPQYLWIDTSHAYGRTTLKFRFLMGIFKFSDPPYGGSNVIFHQIQNFP